MPNPKRRHSQQRSAKRRTHYKADAPLSIDPTTNETHVRHRAHVSEGKLYYRGKVVAEKAPLKAGS